MADPKIRFTAEDATGAAFASVAKNVSNLKTELTLLPAKFAQVAIATAGLGSLAGFADMIQGAVEARARLYDLSLQSNITVQGLAALGKVGKFSNTALEDIVAGSNKLSKALFSNDENAKGAAEGIRALGLDYDKFRSLQPEQQMLEVAQALEKFQDGAGKSAVAMLLFGKQGAQLLPFLKELAERGLEAAKVTTEQALAAKKYEDNLIALKIAGDQWKKTLADDMLPALLEFSRQLVAGREAYGGWFAAIVGIGTTDPFADLGQNLTKTRDRVKELREEMDRSRAGRLTRPESVIQAELDKEQKRYDYFLRLQRMQAQDMASGVYDDPRIATRKPVLVPPPDSKDARALLRKEFDGQIKLIRDFAEQQKDGYEFANQYLKGVYDDGITSLTDFFEKQKAIRAAALQAQVDALDKEIAATLAYRAKADKPQDVQDADNKIAEARQKRAAAIQKASQAEILANQENARATKQLTDAYNDLQATIAGLQGDQAGAAAIRIARQVRDAQELLTKNGAGDAKQRAEAYGVLLTRTEALNRAQTEYGRLVESAGIKEKAALLEAEAAGASERETLEKIAAIRQDSLGALGELVVKARELAEALGTPEARLFADKLALQFRQAAAEADPLLMKTRELGRELGDAVASAAEQSILHWESFRKLLAGVEQDILRILIRSQITQPLGNYLGNLIGGNGQASGGGGLLGRLLPGWFGGSGGAVNFGTSGASFDSAIFGGFFADGGTLQPGQWGIAGENGPEPIYAGLTPLQVMPNTGGVHVVIQQSFAPGTDRRTINQAAAEAGAVVSRVAGRGFR